MGLTLNRDGSATITWTTGGKEWTVELPGPDLQQLGDILDAYDEARIRIDDLVTERNRLRDEFAEVDDDTPIETLARLRKESHQIESDIREVGSQRFITAVETLGTPADAVEKFASNPPAWAHNAAGASRLINHFTSVPFDGPASDRTVETEAGTRPPDGT